MPLFVSLIAGRPDGVMLEEEGLHIHFHFTLFSWDAHTLTNPHGFTRQWHWLTFFNADLKMINPNEIKIKRI